MPAPSQPSSRGACQFDSAAETVLWHVALIAHLMSAHPEGVNGYRCGALSRRRRFEDADRWHGAELLIAVRPVTKVCPACGTGRRSKAWGYWFPRSVLPGPRACRTTQ